ncbi:hypothetical protein FNV43_RR09468 [Rhamnella rubrinervis]|uniref:Uncharacterized protein n=1 Tax=Rhamnella rubrinervis TaxID=2594499 RepID=A0A8K0HBA1_9ROSA|nr:hypothetical protein FNV43_RR09468 [Rhamnella rubrinervis]
MAALNLNLQGNYVPSLDSNAMLSIKFNQKDQVEKLQDLVGDDVVPAEEYSAAPPNVYLIFVPSHVLQHPAFCRSHISYMVKCRGLKLPSIAIDRLAVEVVSAASALAAAVEKPRMGFEMEVKLAVIETTSANINKLEKQKTMDEELVADDADNVYCRSCLEELSSGWRS